MYDIKQNSTKVTHIIHGVSGGPGAGSLRLIQIAEHCTSVNISF